MINKLIALLLIGFSLTSCKTVLHIADTQVTTVKTDDSYSEDERVDALISPYREKLSEAMDVVIGEMPEDLVKSKPHSNMGNWFADVLLEEANKMFFEEVDIAIQNYGGLRVKSVTKGPITKGEVFELMPFDNMLVALNIKGVVLKELLDGIARYGGWPISHTLSFRIGADGQAEDILIKGQPLELDKNYRMAIPDYIANGGDSAEFLKDIPQENSGVLIRDVIIVHLESRQEEELPIIIDNTVRIQN